MELSQKIEVFPSTGIIIEEKVQRGLKDNDRQKTLNREIQM